MIHKIRIAVIEGNPDRRRVIDDALLTDERIEPLSHFDTAGDALSSFQGAAARKVPDIILFGLENSGWSGLEILPRFRSAVPGVRIVILSDSCREPDLEQAVSLGISGWLLRGSVQSRLCRSVQFVYSGGVALDASVAELAMKKLCGMQAGSEPDIYLTGREQQVIGLLASGKARKQIADELKISRYTVASYLKSIYGKLEVSNAPGAIGKAISAGLL